MKHQKLLLFTGIMLLLTSCGILHKPATVEFDTQKANIDEKKLVELDALLDKGLADSCYPGYVLLAAQAGEVFYFRSGGHFTYEADSPEMPKSTIFDMASCTKVVATTSAIMALYDEGKIALDDKVVEYLPEFGAKGKDQITIRDLLTHSSGLPAWSALWKNTENSDGVVKNLFDLELAYETGDKMVYSCMGFITLGKIAEKITGKPLNQFVAEKVYKPLKMKHTFFNPDEKYHSQIAPTEFDSTRGGVLVGKVHDENAYYLDGISGNAGLFSTAEDLAIFSQMMLNKGEYKGTRIFKASTVELFTKRANTVDGSSRCLGWDSPSGNSSSGHYFSANSYGHTGFTGTSIWIDPEKQMFGIFLTNRVHPTRMNRKMYKMRYKVYDLLQESLKDYPLVKNPNVE